VYGQVTSSTRTALMCVCVFELNPLSTVYFYWAKCPPPTSSVSACSIVVGGGGVKKNKDGERKNGRIRMKGKDMRKKESRMYRYRYVG
jgi:hypothetical protein